MSYDIKDVHQNHLRAKRTLDSTLTIKFLAHGRNFHMKLKRDLDTFSKDLMIVGPSNEVEEFDTSHIYQGRLKGKSIPQFI